MENYEIDPKLLSKINSLNKYILSKDSKVSNEDLTLFIVDNKIIEYKCKKCSNEGLWQDKPINLILDRLNNIITDNRIENLRFLCPNCFSQIKKKKILFKKIVKENERYCIDCNKRILAKTKSYNGLKCKVFRCKKCIENILSKEESN